MLKLINLPAFKGSMFFYWFECEAANFADILSAKKLILFKIECINLSTRLFDLKFFYSMGFPFITKISFSKLGILF